MKLYCKYCGLQLTEDLILLSDETLLNDKDNEALIPVGYYIQSGGEYLPAYTNNIIVNSINLLNTIDHYEIGRLNGCCGLDGQDGPNKICLNEHEVAIEYSDCWMCHAVVFIPEAIEVTL